MSALWDIDTAPIPGPAASWRSAAVQRDATYRTLLNTVRDQLAAQLPVGPALPVLIPTVGFGGQSVRVLSHTMRELSRQRASVPISVVLLVNRPQTRPADDTATRARRLGAALGCDAVRFAVAEVALAQRTRLGVLRQLMLDAVLDAQQCDPEATGCVVADDDIVRLPAGTLAGLLRVVTGQARLALGPVLFDSPQSTPAAMLPAFFAADAFRALLAARSLRRLRQPGTSSRAAHAEFGDHAEAIALSCNLAVRAATVREAGGFAPLNEITNLVRDVHGLGGTDAITATWDFDPACENVLIDLWRRAVHISARRALPAYLAHGVPTVGQWRACRFRASRVDPVRVAPPDSIELVRLSTLRGRDKEALLAEISAALTTTLRYFPHDPEMIEDCLAALGLTLESLRVENRSAALSVRIRRAPGLLDRLMAVQDLVSEPL